jgi:hypothetical protein
MPEAIKPVDRRTYQTAANALQKLKPVINALAQIDQQAAGDQEAFDEIQKFGTYLAGIRDRNQAIINQGDLQYQSRPVDLINQAARRLNELPTLIAREEKAMKHKLDAREFESEELRKRNFSVDKINRIVPQVAQSEIDHSNAIVAGHRTEAEAIQKFLGDAPRFDIEILRGTTLYPCHDTITEAAA